jgi:hypothetical protein
MSSPLQGVPQDPRVFSPPAAPSPPWRKIAAAFAAGVGFAAGAACAVLVIMYLVAPQKAAQPQQAKRMPTEVAANAPLPNQQPANTPPASSPQAQPSPTTAPPAGAEPSASDRDAAAPAGEASPGQSADRSCERQTWPYVDHSCAGLDAQAKRSVRVITTDRSAPATVTTFAPPPRSRTTDGMAPPPASTLDRTTDGSAGRMDGATEPSDGKVASGHSDVPLPRAKPAELARTAAAPANGPEVVQQATTSPPPAAAAPRQARKSAERRTTRRSVAERDLATEPNSNTRRADDMREAQDERRTVRSRPAEEPARAARPRATDQEPVQVGRTRATPAQDDEGYALVRSSRNRDGRRVSVQQKQVEEEGGAAARDERPRSPFPFFFNPAASGD